ncbi:dihydrofolate reductase [Pelagibius litoralis]|uniref:Dihydrofolate reductase n=1 Tax=Pelagibius litoralis TaxID=374515 RepID=A0A967C578_9PROT|nr:dihydrofolate reductase family protein [Pelagibius litoralis]NIA68700.1 dihydrofolate reductase [Pelagibius litoralis]
MRNICYDVAVSVNGFIAGPEDDISVYPHEGDHVDAYFKRLETYDAVIMGRRTYEFGYRFGLEPGQRAYPHMQHYIFSRSLEIPAGAAVEVVRDDWVDTVRRLKTTAGGDIYLCGGGSFAGLLLSQGLVDRLRLKVAPVILHAGIALFDEISDAANLTLTDVVRHDSGVTYLSYDL